MKRDWIGFGVRLCLDSLEWGMNIVVYKKDGFSEISKWKWNLRDRHKNINWPKHWEDLLALRVLAAKLFDGLEPNLRLCTCGLYWRRIGVYCIHCRLTIVFTARCYASAVLAMGVCPSVRVRVCLSVTSRCSTKTAKHRITQTTPLDSPGSLVFWRQRSLRNWPGSPPTGAPNAGGVGQNRRLSTNNRLYLENGKR